MGYFVPMGLGTISEDGSELVTNTGSGITKAGWGGLAVPLNSDNAQCDANSKRQGLCGCDVTITADGEEDELWKPFDKNGVNVSFVAKLEGVGCGNATAKWTFGFFPMSLPLTTHYKFNDFGNFNVKVDISCATCSSTTDTIDVNIFQIVIIDPISLEQREDEVETEFLANWTGGQIDPDREIKVGLKPQPSDTITVDWNIESEPTTAGTAASANPRNGTGKDFTFEPMVEHPVYNNDESHGIVDRSAPVKYKIKAKIKNEEVEIKIKQDVISIIRQEYVNHNPPRGVPGRDEFYQPIATQNFTENEINVTAYDMVVGDAGNLAERVRTNYNIILQGLLNLQTVPNRGLVLTSGWRNPERNEAVGGHLNSRHQYGNAIDLRFTASTLIETGLTEAELYQAIDNAGDLEVVNPITDSYCETPTHLRKPCDGSGGAIDHIHIQN